MFDFIAFTNLQNNTLSHNCQMNIRPRSFSVQNSSMEKNIQKLWKFIKWTPDWRSAGGSRISQSRGGTSRRGASSAA
jgi:hypothetical protein